MKPRITNHEILLFSGTSFASRQFMIKGFDGNKTQDHSAMQSMEKACWAGILCEVLPELVGCPPADNKTFIWHIMNGDHFLRISMGPCPSTLENETSVDPYFFMISICKN